MLNLLTTIKTWFFELIEDALGEKTIKQYQVEMDKKNKSQAKDE